MVTMILFLVSSIANAAQYSGTGCPDGSVSVSMSPDQSAVTVLFDRFTLEAGGNSGRKQDRKDCRIEIPVEVPRGMRVAFSQVDYRGFHSLPDKAQATLTVRNAFKGNSGPGVHEKFRGPSEADFNFSTPAFSKWSPCGGLHGITVITQATLRANRETAIFTLDTQDSSASRGFLYKLVWQKCGS